jgi:hypothetical protein
VSEREDALKKNGTAFLGILLYLVMILSPGYSQNDRAVNADAGALEGPQIGQPAPDFELPWADQAGIHTAKNEWVKLSGLRGSNVILAFYVADWTGG